MTDLHYSTSTPGYHHQRYRQPQPPKYSYSTLDAHRQDVPWEHMTQAFTWVEEEEFMKGWRRGMKTEKWVREQQFLMNTKPNCYPAIRPRANRTRRQEWEELIYVYGIQADRWQRQEEMTRKVATEREKARARIQEELRRIEARLYEKREAERIEQEKARRKAQADRREKEARDRKKLERLIADAWKDYEARWAALASSSDALDFKNTPWPLIMPPRNMDDITPDAIVGFLFSPFHSQGQPRKDRLRSAQLRWHPDRFRRFMGRVVDEEKEIVEEGVGIVARCLNELMEKEKRTK